MKLLILFSTTLILTNCLGHEYSANGTDSKENHAKTDTIRNYWDTDLSIYSFDTVVSKTEYYMKTFCLNDSAVCIETTSPGKIEYDFAHNYKTDFVIKTENSPTVNFSILKENFKDSLPSDFFKICHMWKNEYSHFDNGHLIFRATLAKPDSDYQMAVVYSISDKGEFKILKVDDETCNGDEEE